MQITSEQATEFMHATIPVIGRIGVVVDDIEPGRVVLRVPVEGNTNHFGTMYAGVLFTLAEIPGGLIPLTVLDPTKYTPIVTRVDIRFTATARTDITLEAQIGVDELQTLAAQADAEGRAEFILELVGRDETGRTVIESTGYYQLRPSR